MSTATNASVILFLPRRSMDDTPETRSNPTLLPDERLLSFHLLCLDFFHHWCKYAHIIEKAASVYFDQNISIKEEMNAILASFLVSPSWPLKSEFCLTLISYRDVCEKLIRKSKRANTSVREILSMEQCESLGNKQSMERSRSDANTAGSTGTLIRSWTRPFFSIAV